MLFDSLGLWSKPKEEELKEEEENENKEEHKKKLPFYCWQKRWKKGGGYIGVILNMSFSLSYLHESQSILCL